MGLEPEHSTQDTLSGRAARDDKGANVCARLKLRFRWRDKRKTVEKLRLEFEMDLEAFCSEKGADLSQLEYGEK